LLIMHKVDDMVLEVLLALHLPLEEPQQEHLQHLVASVAIIQQHQPQQAHSVNLRKLIHQDLAQELLEEALQQVLLAPIQPVHLDKLPLKLLHSEQTLVVLAQADFHLALLQVHLVRLPILAVHLELQSLLLD